MGKVTRTNGKQRHTMMKNVCEKQKMTQVIDHVDERKKKGELK